VDLGDSRFIASLFLFLIRETVRIGGAGYFIVITRWSDADNQDNQKQGRQFFQHGRGVSLIKRKDSGLGFHCVTTLIFRFGDTPQTLQYQVFQRLYAIYPQCRRATQGYPPAETRSYQHFQPKLNLENYIWLLSLLCKFYFITI
jgi:hypothetical protein